MPQREKYQTRLSQDRAEAVDEYAEDRGISRAEAVRRLITTGLKEKADEEEDQQTDPEKARYEALAEMGEKASAYGLVSLVALLLIRFLAALLIQQLGLTVGTFGALLVNGATLGLFGLALICFIIGVVTVTLAFVSHGVHTGRFGGLLERYSTPRVQP
jgi:hypothetical protein